MRRLFVMGLIALFACAEGREPASVPRAAPPRPAPATEAASAAVATPAAAPRPTDLTAAQARERIRLLREGRQAARAEDWPTALSRFEALLRASPRAPRLACEAGFVAHRADRAELAARWIDLALRTFGEPARIDPALRVPLAMCLYNSGLVHEARGDLGAARADYEASLALRPNATVTRRRDALASAPVPRGDGATARNVEGIAVRTRATTTLVATSDPARLERVVAALFAGTNDFEDGASTGPATITRRGTIALEGRHVIALEADDGSVPLGSTSLVLAFPIQEGFAITAFSAGSYEATDHGVRGGCGIAELAMRVESGLVRVDTSTQCEEGAEEEYAWAGHDDVTCYVDALAPTRVFEQVILCDPRDARCVELPVAESVAAPGRAAYFCFDEDGGEIPGPASTDVPGDHARDHRFAVEAAGERLTRVRVISGTPPTNVRLRPGEHAWDALAAMGELGFAPSPER